MPESTTNNCTVFIPEFDGYYDELAVILKKLNGNKMTNQYSSADKPAKKASSSPEDPRSVYPKEALLEIIHAMEKTIAQYRTSIGDYRAHNTALSTRLAQCVEIPGIKKELEMYLKANKIPGKLPADQGVVATFLKIISHHHDDKPIEDALAD